MTDNKEINRNFIVKNTLEHFLLHYKVKLWSTDKGDLTFIHKNLRDFFARVVRDSHLTIVTNVRKLRTVMSLWHKFLFEFLCHKYTLLRLIKNFALDVINFYYSEAKLDQPRKISFATMLICVSSRYGT